jgi:hypothetical protein
MLTIGAVISYLMANPQVVALGVDGAKAVVNFVTGLFALHAAGVLTDQQLTDLWASMGVDVQAANDHWEQAKARQGHV